MNVANLIKLITIIKNYFFVSLSPKAHVAQEEGTEREIISVTVVIKK